MGDAEWVESSRPIKLITRLVGLASLDPPYPQLNGLEPLMHHGDVSPEIAQGLLTLKKRIAATKPPPSKLDETINTSEFSETSEVFTCCGDRG